MKNGFKRAVLIALAFILILGTTVCSEAKSYGRYIKVGLFFEDTAKDSVTLSAASGLFSAQMNDKDGYSVVASTGLKELVLTPAGPFDGILFVSCDDESIVYVDGKPYRDGIYVETVNGKLNVINYVEIENYIKGVVGNEMNSYYPDEALKAQAVTARSYAYANSGRHGSFDLCTTGNCQVYKGYSSETQKVNAACEATEGQVICYNGKVVQGYYYGNSGGYTLSAKEAWGNEIGYLQAVKDDYSPEYTWSTSMSFDDLRLKMIDLGYDDPGKIKRVYVSERTPNGTAYQFIIEGEFLTHTATKSYMRTCFGGSVLKSQRFSAGPSPDPEIIVNDYDNSVSVLGANECVNYGANTLFAIGADGQVCENQLSQTYIFDGTTTSAIELSSGTEYIFTDQVADSGVIYFSGLGNGHGVGMSQEGARAMGRLGFNYYDILNYYYTDITIENINERQ